MGDIDSINNQLIVTQRFVEVSSFSSIKDEGITLDVIVRLLRQPICLAPGGLLVGVLQLSTLIINKTAGSAENLHTWGILPLQSR